nr:hypothetical protein [Tanacetum cinerariifolium]
MTLKTDFKPKEATFQVVLDALALTHNYRAFLITADVPAIYMQEFWPTVLVHSSSIRFTINKNKVSLDVEIFREILQICPKFPGQGFKDLPLEHDIISFIKDPGQIGDITYLTDVNVDYLHQPWRAFATVINKCLTYETYYAFACGEKTPKLKYVRKKADSDTSPKQKSVQATKGTRIKTKSKVAKSDKNKQPAKKTKAKGLAVLYEVALTKAKQLKLATKISKNDFNITNANGSSDEVDTQSKVPDDHQLKTSGTDEGTGVPDVPKYESKSEKESWGDSGKEDEDDENDFVDKSDGNDDGGGGSDDHDEDSDDERTKSNRVEIPDPNLTIVDQTEHEEKYVDERVHTLSDYELTDDEKIHDEEYIDDEERMDEEEEDEVIRSQQNVSQDLGFEQEEEDAHVTFSSVLGTQKADEHVQSSSISFDFTSKLLNLENPSPADNEIASLMDTTTCHVTTIPKITSSFTITIPPPPLEEAQAEKQEYIDNVDSIVRTNIKEEVKTQLPKILPKAVSAFATSVIERNVTESLEAVVLARNVTESLEAVVLARSSSHPKSTYEADASLSKFKLTNILLDKMEENKSHLRADHKKKLYDALVKSYNTDKDLFNTYGKVFTLKKSRDDSDKDQDPFAGLDRGTKRRKSSKEAESSKDSRSKEKKSPSTSKDASQSQHKSSGKSSYAKEPSQTLDDYQVAHAKESRTSFDELIDTSFDFYEFVLNRLNIKDLTQEILVGPAFELLKGTNKSLTKLEYHLEECSKATTKRLNWHNLDGKLYLFDISKPLPLIRDHRGRQVIPQDFFINNDLDGMLNDVRSALNDIAKGIRMNIYHRGNGAVKTNEWLRL